MALEAAENRKPKVALVGKAIILETSRLWCRVVAEVDKSYEDVELDVMFIGNAAMQMMVYPKQFDVIILTEHMFGGIISNEASVISGSIGLWYWCLQEKSRQCLSVLYYFAKPNRYE